MAEQRTGLKLQDLPEPRPRPLLPALVAAVVLLGGLAGVYRDRLVRHDLYDLGYALGDHHATVENWTLALPLGYRLVYWKSTPAGAQDGFRLFPPDDEAVPAGTSAHP